MLKLLCVDDDESVRNVYGRLLRGHQVTVLSNPLDAICLLEIDSTFDKIFCDWEMGPHCGVELYRWIEANRPDLLPRFVFVSATTGAVYQMLGAAVVVINKTDMSLKLRSCLPAS